MTTNLLGLRAENYKRLELVNIEFPPGGTVAIMGANEAGKTSLLDAIEAIIAGRKATKASKPVHEGADTARIVATFDDIVVTRVYKANGTTSINVTSAEGVRYDKAEEILNRLYSHVALDPLAFSRLTDDEQVRTLLPMIGYDPTPLDAEYEETFELRTIKNREVRAAESKMTTFADPAPGLPKTEISLADLSDDLAKSLGQNNTRENLINELAAGDRRLDAMGVELDKLLASVERVKAEIARERDAQDQGRAALVDFEEIDVEEIREQISKAEATNAAVRHERERLAAAEILKTVSAESAKLSNTLDELKARKASALAEASARMPVPGLSIDDETKVLTLNGIPFSQASTGVKIRTGTAIAMALNPSLRLIVIRDASLLDQGNRDVIDELAKANGFLVLMEIADESSPVGVVIEEGVVREVRKAGDWEA